MALDSDSIGNVVSINIARDWMSRRVTKNKLLKKSKDLENEVIQLRQLATILIDRTDWYQIIFNNCPFGIVITDLDFKLQDANSAFLGLLNYPSFDELKDSSVVGLIPDEFRCEDSIQKNIIDELYKDGITRVNSSLQSTRGDVIPVNITACIAKNDKGTPLKIAGFVEDDSAQAHFDRQLVQKDLEIEKLKKDLDEQKNFHKVILKQAKKNQKDMEESIILNIKEIIFPHLGKLQNTANLTDIQKEYIDLLKSQLNEIISPFYSELSSRYSDLTSMEFRIAGLVKEGKTTKEMARLLSLSAGTVEFHRNNIRKKLGIRNTKVNLRSHLIAME